MIELNNQKLELSNNFEKYLPIIKNVFTEYYGKQYKEIVEEKFSNVSYIFYGLPEHIEKLLRKILAEKSVELVNEFLKENNLPLNKNTIKKYFTSPIGDSINLNYLYSLNLYNIYKYLEQKEHSEFEDNQFLKRLIEISGNLNLTLNSDESNKLIEDIKNMKISFEHMLDKFEEYKSVYSTYFKYLEECDNLKEIIKEKYKYKYLDEIKIYLSDNDRNLIDNRKDSVKFYIWDLESYNIWINISYSDTTLIDSFSSESNAIINNPDTSDWRRNSIYNDRINYFNKMGISLGNDYQSYINNEECLKIIPNIDIVDTIISIRNELKKEEEQEYITSTTNYIEQIQSIEKLGLLDEISYTYDNLRNGLTCINPNIILKDNKYKLWSLLLFPISEYEDNFDQMLIHELNHLFELNLISANETDYKIICGWDLIENTYKKDTNSNSNEIDKKRPFESLNEIINDMLAQEITEMIHNNGIFLFDEKEKATTNGVSYQRTRFLVQEFFEKYKEDIIKSRITGNINILYNKVGKDNFMKLNQLVSEYGDKFNGFSIYKMYQDLENNNLTEDVIYFKKSVEIRNEILKNMEETYSKNIDAKLK